MSMDAVRVTSLHVYPVKSCGAVDVDAITFDHDGPLYDRRWMLAHAEGERWYHTSQRELPRMALIHQRFDDGRVVLSAPGMPEIALPLAERPNRELLPAVIWKNDTRVYEEDAKASAWVSRFLNAELKLVRLPSDAAVPVNPEYSPVPATTSLNDGYPALLISRASLNDLNDRLIARGSDPVSMRRFRPNIVIDGCGPFAEDSWPSVSIGELPFDIVKPCPRCVMTTVDPERGEVDNPAEPLGTLATFRRWPNGKVMFGQNLIHRAQGTIRVGDVLAVREAQG